MSDPKTVFVAGATGYMGSRLCALLLSRGHRVLGLCRAQSRHKLPSGVKAVLGDVLDAASYAAQVPPGCVFVHLVGVAHPSPAKAEQFTTIDLISVHASLQAAQQAAHFVYVSVAHPAPVMAAYIAARQAAERAIAQSGLDATILRPWYVLGPGHRWPYLLLPIYAILRCIPSTAESARRLGLVTLPQMLRALCMTIEKTPAGQRVVDVPGIRALAEA